MLWTVSRTVGAKLYSLLVGVLTLTVTARWLGPEGRGEFAAAMAWVTAFVSISHCSLAEVASQRLAGQAHGQRFNQVALALATAAIGVSILAYAALIGLFLLRPTMFGTLSPWLLLCAFIGLPWMIWEIYGTALLIICERIMLANIGLVLGRTVSILLVLVAVGALGWGVSGALLASVLGQMLVAAMPAWMVWRNWHASHGPVALKQELAGLFSGGVRLHLNAIGSMLMGSTSVIILNAKLGTAATGQFQMAQQLVTILLVLAQATTQMLYGRLGAVGVQGAWRLQRRLVPALSLLTLLAGGVAGALAPWWLPWVAGAGFADAVPLFQWLVPGLAVSAFSTLMAPQWIGRGLFLTASLCSLSAGGVNLLAAWWWVPRMGVMGAVYAQWSALSLALVTNLVLFWVCERDPRRRNPEAGGVS